MIYANQEFKAVHITGTAEDVVDEVTIVLAAFYDMVLESEGKEVAEKLVARVGYQATRKVSRFAEEGRNG